MVVCLVLLDYTHTLRSERFATLQCLISSVAHCIMVSFALSYIELS
jgi:hypothetical protein